MKANFQIADREVLFHILLHPFLFLKIRKKIQEITFQPSSPVRFLLYSDRKTPERLGFELGRDVHAWRTWRNGVHCIGICFGLPFVRKTLIHNLLHEIGHVICHETSHKSHRVSAKTLEEVRNAIREKATIYRQALSELFMYFPPLSKFNHMCQIIHVGEILKDFYANDIMIKHCDPEKRLEGLTAEAEDLCQRLCAFIENVPIVFTNPFTVLNTLTVSAISEASAVRISKQATHLENKLKQSQNRLDKLYEGIPGEAYRLRKELVPFFSNLRENPSSSEVSKYISGLRDCISIFFDTYTWWLRAVKDTLRTMRLKGLVKQK